VKDLLTFFVDDNYMHNCSSYITVAHEETLENNFYKDSYLTELSTFKENTNSERIMRVLGAILRCIHDHFSLYIHLLTPFGGMYSISLLASYFMVYI
jgi:hypothetical protein